MVMGAPAASARARRRSRLHSWDAARAPARQGRSSGRPLSTLQAGQPWTRSRVTMDVGIRAHRGFAPCSGQARGWRLRRRDRHAPRRRVGGPRRKAVGRRGESGARSPHGDSRRSHRGSEVENLAGDRAPRGGKADLWWPGAHPLRKCPVPTRPARSRSSPPSRHATTGHASPSPGRWLLTCSEGRPDAPRVEPPGPSARLPGGSQHMGAHCRLPRAPRWRGWAADTHLEQGPPSPKGRLLVRGASPAVVGGSARLSGVHPGLQADVGVPGSMSDVLVNIAHDRRRDAEPGPEARWSRRGSTNHPRRRGGVG